MTGDATTTQRRRPGYDGDSILAAAVEVFNEHGYDGTSMGLLAERLGISKAGIYYHVTSKEDLLQRACDRALTALESALAEASSSGAPGEPGERGERDEGGETARARVERVLRRAVHVLHDELPYVTLLLRVRGNTEIERAAVQRRRDLDRGFAALVDAAQKEGSLRSDLDALTTTRLVYGAVNSLVEWWRPDGAVTADRLADGLVTMVFHGLDVDDPAPC